MFCLPDGDTDIFYNVTGVLQRDILMSYMFTMCHNVHRKTIDLIKENGFTQKKARRR